jgi:hypothetical protein
MPSCHAPPSSAPQSATPPRTQFAHCGWACCSSVAALCFSLQTCHTACGPHARSLHTAGRPVAALLQLCLSLYKHATLLVAHPHAVCTLRVALLQLCCSSVFLSTNMPHCLWPTRTQFAHCGWACCSSVAALSFSLQTCHPHAVCTLRVALSTCSARSFSQV